jgi:hypothetical protein
VAATASVVNQLHVEHCNDCDSPVTSALGWVIGLAGWSSYLDTESHDLAHARYRLQVQLISWRKRNGSANNRLNDIIETENQQIVSDSRSDIIRRIPLP